jgi:hypothetical protein
MSDDLWRRGGDVRSVTATRDGEPIPVLGALVQVVEDKNAMAFADPYYEDSDDEGDEDKRQVQEIDLVLHTERRSAVAEGYIRRVPSCVEGR